MIKSLLIPLWIALSLVSTSVLAEDSEHGHQHGSHSDVLLLLIADKLKIQKRQKAFAEATSDDQRSRNLNQQNRLLKRALDRLLHYVAIPEGRYANQALFQQSLDNRASMLKDFAELMHTFHQQNDLDQSPPRNNLPH